jgi:hypothetical protein
MIYFVLGMAFAAVIDREARNLLQHPALLLALAIAGLLIVPNILWNLDNGFATFLHTGDNVRGSGLRLDPLIGIEFIATQFAVFGPIAFTVLLAAAFAFGRDAKTRPERLMLAFAIPVLVIVSVTAFATRAHPNWAAAAFVPGAVVVAAFLVRRSAWRLLAANAAIGLLVQIALIASDPFADRVSIPGLAKPDVYERTMGWRALGAEADRIARNAGTQTTVAESRGDIASLLYYHADGIDRVRAWPPAGFPRHHFEMTRPLTAQSPEPVLMISRCPAADRLAAYFADVMPLGRFEAPTGPTTARGYFAFRLSGVRGPLGPLGRCR